MNQSIAPPSVDAPRASVDSVSYRLEHLIAREGSLHFFLNAPHYLSLKLRSQHVYRMFARDVTGTRTSSAPPDTEHRIVRSLGDLDQLLASSMATKYLATRYAREALARDVVLVCLFVAGELAHTTWVVTGPGARLDPFVSRVDYHSTAYICDCYTGPAFRGRGLYPYALTVAASISKEMGFSRNVLVVQELNIPSLLAVRHAGFTECGEVTLRRSFKGLQHRIVCSAPDPWPGATATLAQQAAAPRATLLHSR